MKIKISYFYQIRFFKPYQIPLSTALYPPHWFTNHIDKRGVLNGLSINYFKPNPHNNYCKGCNKDKWETCDFLKEYRQQLSKLNINNVLDDLELIASSVKKLLGFEEEPELILIVYFRIF